MNQGSFPHLQAPTWANAAVLLSDGSVFWGCGLGATGEACGELCFNTSVSGYQEVLSDPSYAGRIVVFTFPHVGNVGVTTADMESEAPLARGIVLRLSVFGPSSWCCGGACMHKMLSCPSADAHVGESRFAHVQTLPSESALLHIGGCL